MTAWGWIDAPEDGAVVAIEDLHITGWAIWDGYPAQGVVLFLDDQPVGAGPTGVRRPDVVQALEPLGVEHAEYAGFAFDVDTSQLGFLSRGRAKRAGREALPGRDRPGGLRAIDTPRTNGPPAYPRSARGKARVCSALWTSPRQASRCCRGRCTCAAGQW